MVLPYYLTISAILAVWFGVYRLWKRRIDADIAEGAKVEWALLERKDPALLKGLDQASFLEIFRKTETPRAPIHVFWATATFLLAAPFILILTSQTISLLERLSIIPQPVDQARQLRVTGDGIELIRKADLTTLQYILEGWGGFFFFFSLLAAWVLIFGGAMRQLYRHRPGSLREEILRSR